MRVGSVRSPPKRGREATGELDRCRGGLYAQFHKHQAHPARHTQDMPAALADMMTLADGLLQLRERTVHAGPDVVT